MADLKVHTAQNVLLEFTLGNVGQRLLAAIIDLAVVALYWWAAFFTIIKVFNIELFGENPAILIIVLIMIPSALYIPVSEYLWSGRTVGKYFLKMRVVRADGSAPSLGDLTLRWLLRTIDVKLGFLLIFFVPRSPSSNEELVFMVWASFLMLMPLPLVGVISMATSKSSQRIGDRVANTVVIRNKRLFSLDDTILKVTEADYEPVYKNVLKLKDKDIYTIKAILDKVDQNHDFSYTQELAAKAREVLEIDDNIKPVKLLRTLVKDYNYMARKKDQVEN